PSAGALCRRPCCVRSGACSRLHEWQHHDNGCRTVINAGRHCDIGVRLCGSRDGSRRIPACAVAANWRESVRELDCGQWSAAAGLGVAGECVTTFSRYRVAQVLSSRLCEWTTGRKSSRSRGGPVDNLICKRRCERLKGFVQCTLTVILSLE